MGQPLEELQGWPRRQVRMFCSPGRLFGSIGSRARCRERSLPSDPKRLQSKPPIGSRGSDGDGCPAVSRSGRGEDRVARPDSVEIVTTSAADGLLVLHDLYYPGWTANVDGNSTQIVPFALLFRGVFVPAGTHRVTFRFEPFSLSNLGAALKRRLFVRAPRAR